MRGIGCLIVVAYHVYIIRGFFGINYLTDHTIGVGGVVVPLFFIISSFSCMCGYYDKILGSGSHLELFYKRRIKRLLPTLYFALLLHSVLDYVFFSVIHIPSMIGTASFLYGLMPQYRESMVDAAWALGIEIIFYLFFPAFLIACKNKKRTWLSFAGVLLLLWAYYAFYSVDLSENNNLDINIIRQLVFFVVGALLFHYRTGIIDFKEKYKAAFFGSCIFCMVWGYLWFLHSTGVLSSVAVSIMYSGVLMMAIGNTKYFCTNRPFVFLGVISYQVYLFHMIFMKLFSSSGIFDLVQKKLHYDGLMRFLAEYLLVVFPTIILSWLWKMTEGFIFKKKQMV